MPQTSTLTEFALAIHFEGDVPLRILDVADWARSLEDDYPIADQMSGLGRVDLLMAPFQLVPAPELPLLRLTSGDGRFYLKLQTDRFVLGWNRTAPFGVPDDYPGFDAMLERWIREVERFELWLMRRFGLTTRARLIELDYMNAKPLQQDARPIALADVFKFMKTTGRVFNGFQMQWTELLDMTPAAARVNASTAIGLLKGTHLALTFNFIGFAPLSGEIGGAEVRAAIDALHGRILDMYEATIISDRV